MVQIKIDQAAHPPGVAGIAREDLATGTDITLTATGGPYLQYLWRIINKPLDVLTSTRASSVLATPDASSTVLSPIDVAGTYLIEVSVDSGLGLGARIEDVARITFYAGPTLATDPDELPRREPAIGETTQHNVAGNDEGWGAELRRWFAVIRNALRRLEVITVLNDPTDARDQSLMIITGTGSVTLPANPISTGYSAVVYVHNKTVGARDVTSSDSSIGGAPSPYSVPAGGFIKLVAASSDQWAVFTGTV